jgi:putative ABC transport system ATP-binding protein
VEVLSVFQSLNAEGRTIILVTHEPDIAVYAGRVVVLRDGMVIRDEPVRDRRDARADLAAMKKPDPARDLDSFNGDRIAS